MNCTNKQQETCDVEKRTCEGCFYNEKTADEILYKIGYIKEYEDSTIEVWNYEKRFCIKFNKICKSVDFQRKDKRQFLGLKFHRISIDMLELQAINKKVQELRLERINIMEEKLLVSLQELQSAIDSGGSIDTGDISYDSIKVVLEFITEQIKENKKCNIKMTDKQYRKVIDLVEYDANKKWEDKIKAKIEEYQNKIDKLYNKKMWNEPVDTINKNRYANYINILQSLLEREEKENG